ncbi:PREDICTED: uncharacterized protein LOC109581847 [Amphimedon queenslandica]|uniref:G-protein coupled receptors family 3 profile domain-containing protein n=1 Tax=Amphimedon queenslandica TaxID=400682 RepID=A0A1X7UXM8_AMPQE|nr:PREDICTED: uncharacterized protein LOC109581847 [Amphimedon queenslandica]|eukprot:XP_019851862.1 PREDICTED: uncharacterized protein LOC109581847 [Amphimedon queenslandica]
MDPLLVRASPVPDPMYNTTPDSHYLEPINCYNGKDKNLCIRIGVLITLVLITAGLVLARIIQYHTYKNRHYAQYFILYTGLIIVLILSAHTIYFPQVQWDFTAILLVAIQLLSIWFYYLFWAFRLLKKEYLFLYGVLPLLIVLILSFIGVFLWASITASDNSHECTRPQWLIFSTSQLLIVQLLLATVIYICCKLNHVRTVRTNRWSQKAQLIFIVIVYEIASLFTFFYDLYLISSPNKNCLTDISTNEGVVIFLQALLTILRTLGPQIAIVIIFAPLKPYDEERETQLERNIYYPNYSSYSETQSTQKSSVPSYPIQPPTSIKPSSPEDHFPSLPRSTPYTPSSGYNFYNFRSSSTVN